MTLFVVFAALLVVVVALFLLPPLWLGLKPAQESRAGGADRQAANLAIFRDQLLELEREKADGSLAETDFAQAKRELQHRLLAEAQPVEAAAGDHRPSRKTAIVLVVLLPLLGLGGYGLLGNPKALDPALTAPRPQLTAAQIEGMVAKLAERLKANPEDAQGWVMLARSYKAMGRHAESAAAYGKAEKLVAQDAELLADYAEALAMSSNTGIKGKPRQLVDQALKLEPENPHALLLAGAGAMQAGNRAEALRYWEKLLPMVEPGSEIESMLKGSIDKLRQGK